MSSKPRGVRAAPEVECNFGFLLKQLHHLVRNTVEARLRSSGVELTFPHALALHSLMREPGLSGADLARQAMVTPQTMHGILLRLDSEGLIERRPDPGHGRILRTRITAKGKRLLERGTAIADEVMGEALMGLTPLEQAELTRLMQACVETLTQLAPDGAAAAASACLPMPAIAGKTAKPR